MYAYHPGKMASEAQSSKFSELEVFYRQPHHVHFDFEVLLAVDPRRSSLQVMICSRSAPSDPSSVKTVASTHISIPHCCKLLESFQSYDRVFQSIAHSVFIDVENSSIKLRLEAIQLYPARVSSFGRKALLLHQVCHSCSHHLYFDEITIVQTYSR